jgi:membrane protease YdiL (CAAX protease family)
MRVLHKIFRNVTGQVRSGWVFLAFAVVSLVLTVLWSVAVGFFTHQNIVNLESPGLVLLTLSSLVASAGATAVLWPVFRTPTGLRDALWQRHLGQGLGFGFVAIAAVCVVPMLAGATRLTWNPQLSLGAIVLQGLALAPAGLGEEIWLRGFGFQALRRGLGDGMSVVLSSLAFGVMHLVNPHASWVAAVMVALVGLWFGLMAVQSGSVWMSVGTHLAWNFGEGVVFGQPTSGIATGSPMFTAEMLTANRFWVGGDFGPEAAGWTAVVLSAAVVITFTAGRRTLRTSQV